MTALERTLAARIGSGRKILSVFITAGLPSPGLLPGLVEGLAGAGADIVELGIPFSDPIADGPVIQASSHRALELGVTPASVLTMVREIRKCAAIPIILMGYANPLFSYGLGAFVRDASAAGADGMIIPDLPPEESTDYRSLAATAGLSTIFLVSQTTPDERIVDIGRVSTGFVYGVSTLGVTGVRDGVGDDTLAFLRRARPLVGRTPFLAGFGISDATSARTVAAGCDGVIVGSALVSRLAGGSPGQGTRAATEFTATLRTALDSR